MAVLATFLIPVLVGGLLLRLPPCQARAAQRATWSLPAAGSVHFSQALLTATGAVTCAGLSGRDLGHLSPIGLGLVIVLVQYGSLMTIAWSTCLMLRWIAPDRPPRFGATLALAAAFLIPLQCLGTLLLLGAWELPLPMWTRLGRCLFYAVNGTTQAGFSLPSHDLSSMRHTAALPGVMGPLVFVGGLGLPVWLYLWRRARDARRRARPDTAHRLVANDVLSSHAALACGGSLVLFLAGTLLLTIDLACARGSANEGGFLTALADGGAAALTVRSAGFAPLRDDQLSSLGHVTLLGLAIFGTCPGSSGGGMKITNFLIIVAGAWHLRRSRGAPRTEMRGAAATVALLLLCLLATVAATTLTLQWLEPVTPRAALGESVRAATLTALPTAMSAQLTPPGKAVIIAAMLVGRMGPILLVACMAARHRRVSPSRLCGAIPGP